MLIITYINTIHCYFFSTNMFASVILYRIESLTGVAYQVLSKAARYMEK